MQKRAISKYAQNFIEQNRQRLPKQFCKQIFKEANLI